MTAMDQKFRIKQLSKNDDVDEKVIDLYQKISHFLTVFFYFLHEQSEF